MTGGLLELVARGKKDLFFTANPNVSFFHSVYIRASPFTKEVYLTKPRNIPEWGRWVDFDIDHRGDLVKQFYLRIELPTWLPSVAVEANQCGIVTDASGVSFGYVNNVGYLMLKKIQVFQDQVLLHEVYGEYLDWRMRQMYDYTTSYAISGSVGYRPDTVVGISRSASQGMLRVPIPLLGYQDIDDPGFPTIALRNQRFRIRVHLRPLHEVIVASDGRLHPKPWDGKVLHIQRTKNGPIDTSQVTLPFVSMKHITMSLETTQVYVPSDVQVFLKASVLRFPFRHIQFHEYTLEDNVLTAAAYSALDTFNFPMPVDCIGSVDRVLLGFRTEASTFAGQLTNLRPPAPADRFIRTLRLNIANIDRIKRWNSVVFREVAAYWKNDRMGLDINNTDLPQEIYTISFGGYDFRRPAGTLNFTRASLPTVYLTLHAIPFDVRNTSRKTSALLYAESWNVFEIAGGKGRMMFDDS